MRKYLSNSFIQSLLLLALAAFMVTIYFMTTNISEQVAAIETQLDAIEAEDNELAVAISEHAQITLKATELIGNDHFRTVRKDEFGEAYRIELEEVILELNNSVADLWRLSKESKTNLDWEPD